MRATSVDDWPSNVLRCWAELNLPARIDAAQTAKALGFGVQDIPVLIARRKLTPLGNPAPNAPKLFSAVEIIRLAADRDWLDQATKEVAKYWRNKRERQSGSGESTEVTAIRKPRKASTKPSTDSSITEQLGVSGGAVGEQ